PVDCLPRFGRMLAQSGLLLITRLYEEERSHLQTRRGPEIAPEIVSDALPEELIDVVSTEDQTSEGDADSQQRDAPEIVAASIPEEPARRLTPLGELQLGRQSIFLYLQEDRDRRLTFHWDGRVLEILEENVGGLLDDLRTLYYDALRGRRSHVSSGTGDPAVNMSIHNVGSASMVVLEHDIGGKVTRLQFPVGDVPTFLNVAESVMARIAARDL
ncbi:MAG: hypothetical protein ACRDFX_05895, partial [Chloroflexota bacterium]